MKTPLLDKAATPEGLRQLPQASLKALADELRDVTIAAVSRTGGHLGAGLGVVELSIALHYVFDTPQDKLIWDVGHQTYPHKILTARRDRIASLRQSGGLSGFTRRSESQYDPFGAAHSSTSISAGLGMSVARDLKGEDFNVVAVIGDGAMSAGMAYEAMNNAGALKSRMIVILNDNEMSIAPAVGALSNYLSHLISSRPFHSMRELAKQIARRFPAEVARTAKRAEEMARGIVGSSTIFSQLGFFYIGPVDGHDLDQLVPILRNLRDSANREPILLHVVTEKGRGHPFGRESGEKYHAVPQFDVITGEHKKTAPVTITYTSAFADQLIKEAKKDDSIVAITAAMPSGTGLDKFAEQYPTRCFDVGIAEQHGVTFAAGLAATGMKPFVAVYSTFLQRGYDQVVHDVALQKLPVRFAIDRAGLIGNDGATHVGAYDLAYLCCLPDMVVMAPADEAELTHAVATAALIDDTPCAFRYPRGEGTGCALPETAKAFDIGKGRVVQEGERLAILSLGTRLGAALTAAQVLASSGVGITVADARFAKPLDTDLIDRLMRHHESLILIEEGSAGGFAAHVMQYLANSAQVDRGVKIRVMTLPDKVIDHNSQGAQLAEAGLDSDAILAVVAPLLEIDLASLGTHRHQG